DRVHHRGLVAGAAAGTHRPVQRADDARGDRAGQLERRTDGDHRLADAQVVGPAELHRGQVADAADLDHGDVGRRVAADDLGGGLPAVLEHGLDLPAVRGDLDDVVVGQDVA